MVGMSEASFENSSLLECPGGAHRERRAPTWDQCGSERWELGALGMGRVRGQPGMWMGGCTIWSQGSQILACGQDWSEKVRKIWACNELLISQMYAL